MEAQAWVISIPTTNVLVDSFHLIPRTQVSGNRMLWVAKRSWKSMSYDKKCTTSDVRNMFYLVTLQKIRTVQKFKREPEYLRSFAEKTFRKHQKITAYD